MMFAGSRWTLGRGVLLLFAASALLACHKDKPQKAQPAEVKNPAQLQRTAEAARQSLAGLKPKLSALNTKFAALHKQYDPLPAALPDFSETRAKFYSTAEGLGMLGAKVPWLSGRIDSALKSGDRVQLAEVSKDVAHTYDELRQVDRIAAELLHEVQPFQRRLADLHAQGKNSCE